MTTFTNSTLANVEQAWSDTLRSHGSDDVAVYYTGKVMDAETNTVTDLSGAAVVGAVFGRENIFQLAVDVDGTLVGWDVRPVAPYTFEVVVKPDVPSGPVVAVQAPDAQWLEAARKAIAKANGTAKRERKAKAGDASAATTTSNSKPAGKAKAQPSESLEVVEARKKHSTFLTTLNAIPEGDPMRAQLQAMVDSAKAELDAAIAKAEEQRKAEQAEAERKDAAFKRAAAIDARYTPRADALKAQIAQAQAEFEQLGVAMESDDDSVALQARADRKVVRERKAALETELAGLRAVVEAEYDAELVAQAEAAAQAALAAEQAKAIAEAATLTEQLAAAASLLRQHGWDVAAPYAHDGRVEGEPLALPTVIEMPAKAGKKQPAKAAAE